MLSPAASKRLSRSRPGVKEREAERRRRPRDRSKEREAIRRRKHENWPKHILRTIRFRAHKKGLEFAINENDIPVPTHCPVLGIPLVIDGGFSSPSVDRFDNNEGYVSGNVFVISRRANSLKSNATIDELERVLAYMKEESVS